MGGGGRERLNDFKSGTFIGRFPSDGAASTAAKGLMPNCLRRRAGGDRDPGR